MLLRESGDLCRQCVSNSDGVWNFAIFKGAGLSIDMIVFPRNKAIVYHNPAYEVQYFVLFIVDSGEAMKWTKASALNIVVRYKWLYCSNSNL